MNRITLTLLLPFICFGGLFAQSSNQWRTAIYAENLWSYMIGESSPETNWNRPGFNSNTWLLGAGGIGYGDSDDNTVIEPAVSLYCRREFTIPETSNIEAACLHIDYDDGFVAYMNGVEIARNGLTGKPPEFDELAFINHEAQMYTGGRPEIFMIDQHVLESIMIKGTNVLAIQVHNTTETSSDLTARAYLSFSLWEDNTQFGETPDWFYTPFGELPSSNLPIIKISTLDGTFIPKTEKVRASMKIIDNGTRNYPSDTANIYDGLIGIKVRGHASSTYPQKPYSIETRDSLGENRNVELWHMPRENDWILLANYNDKTFMRNTLSFHLFNRMGHFASRTKLCELMLNDEYQGIYVFTERIKQDKGRVDIAKLDTSDIGGDDLSGGYIFKVDYSDGEDGWPSKYYPLIPDRDVFFVYHDPELEDLKSEQASYIEAYTDGWESVLYSEGYQDVSSGYRTYIDVSSFVDYMIMSEITRNGDGYKKSKYYFKDKDSKGGLLHSGPVWDYDWAFKDQHSSQADGSGWTYTLTQAPRPPHPDQWIIRLMDDPLFANAVHNRYYSLRNTILSNAYLMNYIDSIQALVDEAQERHYDQWKTLGKKVGTPEAGLEPTTYAGEVTKFKNWISRRLKWLDREMAYFYTPGLETEISEITNKAKTGLRVFPNPARDYVYVESLGEIQSVGVYNAMGQLILSEQGDGGYSIQLDISALQSNIYFIRIRTADNQLLRAKFIKN